MADYYPLIAKAVSGLEKSTGEARRALYDRARTALLAQLRGGEPALSEPDITRERLALEEAIRKVEAEAARRSRNDPLPGRPELRQDFRQDSYQEPVQEAHTDDQPADPPPRGVASALPYDLPAPRPPVTIPADDGDHRSHPEETRAVPLSAAAARPVSEPPRAEEPRSDVPRGPASGGEGLRTERPRWSPGDGPSLSDKGLKGFRDVVAETETLGSATAQAARNVRAYQAATNAEFERFVPRADGRAETRTEPRGDPEPVRPSSRRPLPRDTQKPAGREPALESGRGLEARDLNRGRGAESERLAARRTKPPPGDEPDESAVQDANFDVAPPVRSEYAPRPRSSTVRQDDAHPPIAMPSVVRAERPPERDPEDHPAAVRDALRLPKNIVPIAVVALVALAFAAVAFWAGPNIIAAVRGVFGVNRTADQIAPAESNGRGKIVERAPSVAASGEGALVAQKVVLYEEDQSNPNGMQFVGSAVWRTERVAPGPGQTPDAVVRAEIEIPEQKISLRWSLRRNEDKQLPASHTIEIMFTLPADYPHGGISTIPGVLMKQGETTRGIPLVGGAVKVTTNFFLIGLSSVDADMQRNIQLLKERSWFDIPVVYGDGKRAIIAIEKGTPGERAFTDAFAAWGQ